MRILQRLLSLVAPHECLVCETEGSLLCGPCSLEVGDHIPERCYKCYRLSPDSRVCDVCRRKTPLSHVWVRAEYEGAIKQLLHDFKFERAQSAAEVLVELLDENVPYLDPKEFIVCYVPTATSRVRARGYDHARLLAKAFALQRGLLLVDVLARHGQTRQVGARREQRKRQIEGAFRSKKAYLLKDKKILLLDDIITTGATIETAAATLKQAGAKQVYAAAIGQRH